MRPVLRRFLRHPGAVAGALVLLAVVGVAAFASVLFPDGPWDMAGAPFQPPGEMDLPLGTDSLGRNLAAGIAYGARVSLLVGAVATVLSLLIGVTLGSIAGYCGGWVDDVVMRVTEFFQTIPSFVLAILLVAIFTPSIVSIVGAIAVVSWPPVTRVVRAEVLGLRSREFVQAAEVLGKRPLAVVLTDILPNALSPVIVLASLMAATAILLESSLSFLGLGDPNLMSWGFLIGSGRSVIRIAWWMSVFPGLAIVVTVLALNLVGEGLSDALNPRLRGRGDPR